MNYSLFGDTITFDPTYGTNKYHMAFTPFTGVENHKNWVTFAAALVDHENDESFIWVFKKFLDFVWDTDLEPIEFEEKWSQSAMEQQHYNQRFLDAASDSTLPHVYSKTMIEKHASKIYTHTVFYEFQEQVEMAPSSCAVRGFSDQGNMHIISVEDSYRKHRIFQESKETTCMCRMFKRKEILCKHIIWIISRKGLHCIPEQYIESRWTKKSFRKPLYGLDGKLLQDYDPTDLRKLELSRVIQQNLILMFFRQRLQKNKGSGKRMKSNKDKAIEKASKPKRLCNNCKQMGNHDKRNSPNPFVEHALEKEDKEEDEMEDEDEEEE
ncbi:protein FAR1-RELATED SEQUENCE 9-like [Silene latifolia]|uniref:protein FAR1-RELATED SEQUENCE 9-like n=1 Tax=Silene latifolia TaxID=37657 RepID=UPI003D779F17